ncbi:MAG: alpha/beta fold hydrolase [Isosphaeraceae bacterium]
MRVSPSSPGVRDVRSPRALGSTFLALVLALALPACGRISANREVLKIAANDRIERSSAPRYGPVAFDALNRAGLLETAAEDPATAARLLANRGIRSPSGRAAPETWIARSELTYQTALKLPSGSGVDALILYRDAALFAKRALDESRSIGLGRTDPRNRAAISAHNRAVERLLRSAHSPRKAGGESWRENLAAAGVGLASPTRYLAPSRFDRLAVAADFRIKGMARYRRSDGLGVPLVAFRYNDPSNPNDPQDHYYPPKIWAAATAVLAPNGTPGALATLYLIDPYRDADASRFAAPWGLAYDRTTPLALEVDRGNLVALELGGLLCSELLYGQPTGILMLGPYEPGKIPVVLVHGVVSSPPSAWVRTYQELRDDPVLRARYQFWVFQYPTGLPIPSSAARFRAALTEARETFDPTHADPALDRMVLIGHSMGGLLSKMMAQDSGMALWDILFNTPYDRLQASAELRERLTKIFIFRRLPFVRRLVFISTPHQGSLWGNRTIGRLTSHLIPSNEVTREAIRELIQRNGPGVLTSELRGNRLNSIGVLAVDSPTLKSLARLPINPNVAYHSIIPQITTPWGKSLGTDGIVGYWSSHIEGARSEFLVAGSHVSQQRPEVIAELRRILLEHLAENSPESPSPVPAPLLGDIRDTERNILYR